MRPGGRIAAIATPVLDLDLVLDGSITVHGVLIQDNGERTRRLAALLADGTLCPVVSHVLPLCAAADAHRIIESGHADGKVVLEVTGAGQPRLTFLARRPAAADRTDPAETARDGAALSRR